MIWETWKKGFDTWEAKTAELMEKMLKSRTVLEPMGAMLSATMKAKAASDKAVAQWWSGMGLPTRRDQERTLHALNQLNSKLLDMEERLAELQDQLPRA
jgi:hypothetical protein